MATTKKQSTKAKTKTTKKPATKSAKIYPSSRREAGQAKKSVETKVTKSLKAKKPIGDQLIKLNLFTGVFALVLAAVAGFLMNSTSFQLFTGLLTTDELASESSTIFVPAIHSVVDVELRWMVVGILILSAVLPLLAATKKRKQYQDALAQKVMFWRWVDMAIVSALSVEVVAILSGVRDIMTLKFIGAFMVITAVLSWFSEKRNAGSAKPVWGNYALSMVTATLPWLMIAVFAVGTVVWGQVRSPWYVYALYASTLTVFLGYAMNGMRQLKAQQTYEVTERNYLQLSILFKFAFAVILIVGLYSK